MADYTKEINQENIYKRISGVIPKNILERIKVFYLRGGINYKKLSKPHKIMMAMMKKMIEKIFSSCSNIKYENSIEINESLEHFLKIIFN